MALELPPQIFERMAGRRVLLFAGAGVSAPQLPGWLDLLQQMLDWAQKERITLTLSREEIQELINDGDLLLAAQTLREQMGDSNFYTFLQRTFRDSKLTPNAAHRSLPKLNLAAILTTNYDKLIE